jgi:alpha-amylase
MDNEELCSLLTTIKNQGDEIQKLQKEVTKWQGKAKRIVTEQKSIPKKAEPKAKAV